VRGSGGSAAGRCYLERGGGGRGDQHYSPGCNNLLITEGIEKSDRDRSTTERKERTPDRELIEVWDAPGGRSNSTEKREEKTER